MSTVCVCVGCWKCICTKHTHIYTQVLIGQGVPKLQTAPKDGHNLFYNRLVSAQVENVTTYLCWQDAILERAINRRGLTALPSASRAPSMSTPTPTSPPPISRLSPPASLSLHPFDCCLWWVFPWLCNSSTVWTPAGHANQKPLQGTTIKSHRGHVSSPFFTIHCPFNVFTVYITQHL